MLMGMENDQPPKGRLFGGRREKAIALGAVLCILVGGGAVAATVVNGESSQAAVTPGNRASISVDINKIGAGVRSDTFGLSLDTSALLSPGFGAGNMVQYFKTLGGGVLRVGGTGADETFWTTSDETAPDWAKYKLTPKHLEKLAAVSNKSGWKVVLGLNFRHFDPVRAGDQVAVAVRIMGDRIKAVTIGHEPETYYDDPAKFADDYQAYMTEINKVDKAPKVIGPEVYDSIAQGIGAKFADMQTKKKEVSALTFHHYAQSVCDKNTTDVEKLLSSDTYAADKKVINEFVGSAKKVGLGVLLTETNSVDCDGKKGVSDTHASALWALDYGLSAASAGADGVYFHGSLAGCDSRPPAFKWYTPLCAPTARDQEKGKLVAEPVFYGLLALHQAGSGSFVGVDNSRWGDLRAYAIKSSSRLRVVIVNVANPQKHGTTPVSLRFNGGYGEANVVTLSNKSNKLTAAKGTNFGGASVLDDGTIEVPKIQNLFVAGDLVETSVPAGSAVIISLS